MVLLLPTLIQLLCLYVLPFLYTTHDTFFRVDFDMSDAQQDHAAVIERIAPRLAALRIELCPCHMSEGYFWKVYFVLLHSRLHKQDAGILSTPQVSYVPFCYGFHIALVIP